MGCRKCEQVRRGCAERRAGGAVGKEYRGGVGGAVSPCNCRQTCLGVTDGGWGASKKSVGKAWVAGGSITFPAFSEKKRCSCAVLGIFESGGNFDNLGQRNTNGKQILNRDSF